VHHPDEVAAECPYAEDQPHGGNGDLGRKLLPDVRPAFLIYLCILGADRIAVVQRIDGRIVLERLAANDLEFARTGGDAVNFDLVRSPVQLLQKPQSGVE